MSQQQQAGLEGRIAESTLGHLARKCDKEKWARHRADDEAAARLVEQNPPDSPALNAAVDVALVVGALVLCCFAPAFMGGPDELVAAGHVADEVAYLDDMQARAERQVHASAAQPVRKRHQSVVAQGEQ